MWTRIRRRTLVVPLVVVTLAAFSTPAHASITATVWNTAPDRLIVRSAPGLSATEVTRLTEGTEVTVECQTRGDEVDGSTLWDYLPAYDGYASDRYLYTGHDGPHPDLPDCDNDGATVEGFDNSNNNEGTIDFAAAGKQFGFAIMKASESTDFVDAYFAERFQAAEGDMDVIGAYHFFDPRTDGAAQAEHNLAVLADAGYDVAAADTLPIMVDIEPNYVEPGVGFCFDTDVATMNQRLSDYVDHIITATGQAPMVYTNGEMINDCGLDTAPLTDQPLVVPAWDEWGADPLATARALGWDDWTFWQYDSYITVPGGVGALADRFNGDTDALAALAAA